ncbi:hypothetical protein CDAR_234391 [Caerostris darwini]|uniref:Uncharacterized protein n=1 Tax=Caerostris darwini TaxID=1538125 RepID=A0AAV4MH22_9ARAC|nr:hypothetical protein CDAR_234391 [Caerostris darwini]
MKHLERTSLGDDRSFEISGLPTDAPRGVYTTWLATQDVISPTRPGGPTFAVQEKKATPAARTTRFEAYLGILVLIKIIFIITHISLSVGGQGYKFGDFSLIGNILPFLSSLVRYVKDRNATQDSYVRFVSPLCMQDALNKE